MTKIEMVFCSLCLELQFSPQAYGVLFPQNNAKIRRKANCKEPKACTIGTLPSCMAFKLKRPAIPPIALSRSTQPTSTCLFCRPWFSVFLSFFNDKNNVRETTAIAILVQKNHYQKQFH